MTTKRLLIGASAALGALAVGTVLAAPVPATGRPLAPAVGYAQFTRTHLVLWAEDRGTGTGLDLFAVRTTSSGTVVGVEVPIVIAPGDQSDPTLAFNERLGEFLVVYTNSGGPGANPTQGVPIPGTQSPPLTPPPPPPPPPPLGAWRAEIGLGAQPAQPVPTVASPTPTGPPLPQPTLPTPGGPTPGGPTSPPPTNLPPPYGTIPPPPSTAPGSRDLYGLWVSESGLPITNSFPIITSPADETYPSLAYRDRLTSDQWVLVWREVSGLAVSVRTVEMTGFGGRGMVFSSNVNTVVSGADHGRPSVAVSTQPEFLVVWSQSQPPRVDRDVLARRLNSNGFPIGSIIGLVESVEDQVYPTIGALRDTGDYLLAYEERPAGAESDIKIRRLNRNGAPLRNAYSVAAGPPFSFAPSLPATGVGNNLLLVWLDRNAASDNSVMGAEVIGERILGPQREIVAGGVGAQLTPIVPPPLPPFPPIPPAPPTP